MAAGEEHLAAARLPESFQQSRAIEDPLTRDLSDYDRALNITLNPAINPTLDPTHDGQVR